MDLQVTNNEAKHRFEAEVNGYLAIAQYRRQGETIVFTHTEVPEELEGQGVGGKLVRGALEQVRAAGGRVIPACSFVAGFMDRHPEYQSLLAQE